jgi:hypothetical protein
VFKENNLTKCKQCGSTDIGVQFAFDDGQFYLWVQCGECDNNSGSVQTYLEAANEWNIRNGVESDGREE